MNKKTIRNILYGLAALLLVGVAAYTIMVSNAYGDEAIPTADFITISELAVMAILSCYYALVGCNKEDGAPFFKLYLSVFALFELVTVATSHMYETGLEVMMIAFRFGCLMLLSQAKDLGENKSVSTAIAIIVGSVVELVSICVTRSGNIFILGVLIEVLLEAVCLVMVMAKYADKKERGSK